MNKSIKILFLLFLMMSFLNVEGVTNTVDKEKIANQSYRFDQEAESLLGLFGERITGLLQHFTL